MSDKKHSPGRWLIHDDAAGRRIHREAYGEDLPAAQRDILDADGCLVATTNGVPPDRSLAGCGGDPMANARLIAAAPDLLAALEAMLAADVLPGPTGPLANLRADGERAQAMALLAIRKAKGE